MDEIYFSADVESNGPAPGINSMLSFGLAVFQQGELVDTFSRNLELLEGSEPNPETMAWWEQARNKEAWDICRENLVSPAQAMQDAAKFIEQFPEKRVCVGWPIAFDFGMLNWYFWKFVGRNPLGFGGLDLRSYVAGALHIPRYLKLPESEINALAKKPAWLKPHVALDDSIQQGLLWVAAQEYAEGRKECR